MSCPRGKGQGRASLPEEGGGEAGLEVEAGIPAKLILTLLPFAVVLVFLVAEWLIRGRS